MRFLRQYWAKFFLSLRFRRLPFFPHATIQTYIFMEILPPSVVGACFFTLVFALQRIGELVALTLEKSTPFSVTLQLFLYMLPFTAAITIPMGVLFGVIYAYGKLSGNSEIIAMKATRLSTFGLFLPALVFGFISMVGMFLFIDRVMPETNFRYKTLYKAVIYSNPGILLSDRVFTELPNTEKKISSFDTSEDGKTMHSVFIFEKNREEKKIKVIYSEQGRWLNNGLNSPLITLKLHRGRSLEVGITNFDDMQSVRFEEIDMNIANTVQSAGIEEPSLREKDLITVFRMIQERLKKKSDISTELYIEFHKKMSIPFACLVFVFLGMPLGISFSRSGGGISFGSALLIIFIYYALLTLGETLGNKKVISAQLSMWIPNIVLLLAGGFFFWRKARE
jgi:lipopolysaccharide export system permease protein